MLLDSAALTSKAINRPERHGSMSQGSFLMFSKFSNCHVFRFSKFSGSQRLSDFQTFLFIILRSVGNHENIAIRLNKNDAIIVVDTGDDSFPLLHILLSQ